MATVAICDPYAFYPLRSLVEGNLRPDDLPQLERLIRAIVLHDAVKMILDPWPDQREEKEWEPEELAAGARPVIVAVGPVIERYSGLIEQFENSALPNGVALSPE